MNINHLIHCTSIVILLLHSLYLFYTFVFGFIIVTRWTFALCTKEQDSLCFRGAIKNWQVICSHYTYCKYWIKFKEYCTRKANITNKKNVYLLYNRLLFCKCVFSFQEVPLPTNCRQLPGSSHQKLVWSQILETEKYLCVLTVIWLDLLSV